MKIEELVTNIKQKKDKVGGIKELYFVACGGSLAAFYPAKYFLESESKSFKVGYYTSNEFVHATPKALGENSIVVLSSQKGNTPETVEAAKLCKSRGIDTIALTNIEGSPLTEYADHVIIFEMGTGSRVENKKSSLGLKIAVEILNQTEGYANYDKMMDGFNKINAMAEKARKHVERRALQFAEEYKDEKVIYVMSSGASYGSAHQESICVLLEMQWINSASVHSGDFFHGPFEITDAETPFILLMNEGRTRALDERALTFLNKYGKKIIVIDSKELGINVIDDSVVEFFNPFLLSSTLNTYNKELAAARKHPLTHRRYMWKVEY